MFEKGEVKFVEGRVGVGFGDGYLSFVVSEGESGLFIMLFYKY